MKRLKAYAHAVGVTVQAFKELCQAIRECLEWFKVIEAMRRSVLFDRLYDWGFPPRWAGVISRACPYWALPRTLEVEP